MFVTSLLELRCSLTSKPIQMEMEYCQAYTKENLIYYIALTSMTMILWSITMFVYVRCVVGNVHVYIKDSIFQASSPTRHTAELGMLITEICPSSNALILFIDGGPVHNNMHTLVRLGLLALFLELDLDTRVVIRTKLGQPRGKGHVGSQSRLARSCSRAGRDR
jgi:hypothetical protein